MTPSKQDLIEELYPLINAYGVMDAAENVADFILANFNPKLDSTPTQPSNDYKVPPSLDTEELEKQIHQLLDDFQVQTVEIHSGESELTYHGSLRSFKGRFIALLAQHTQVAVDPKTPNDHWVEFVKSDRGGHYLTNINTGEIRQVDTEGKLWRKNPDNGQYERFKQLEQRKPDLPPANPTNTIMKGL